MSKAAAPTSRPVTVQRFALGAEPKEYEHWLQQPPSDRLAGLTGIIQQHLGWTDANVPRLARVARVLKRTSKLA